MFPHRPNLSLQDLASLVLPGRSLAPLSVLQVHFLPVAPIALHWFKKKYIKPFIGITAEAEVVGTVWFVDFLFLFCFASAFEICGILKG